jgi:hypothetical protein
VTLYLDSSALLKRYIREPGTREMARLLELEVRWVAANHGYTEVAINLRRRLVETDVGPAASLFEEDWARILVIDVDDLLCHRAADLAVDHGLQTLDALHLAAAERAGGPELTFVTFDSRLAGAARQMGFPVAGA